MTNLKSLVLGLSLAAGLGVAAQAQTISQGPVPGPSIANLPPEGPRPSSLNNIPSEPKMTVTPSGQYIGPAPGAANGAMPPHFDKPAGYDADASLHPYSSNLGPKPN